MSDLFCEIYRWSEETGGIFMEENLWWEVFFNSQETEDMIMAAYHRETN